MRRALYTYIEGGWVTAVNHAVSGLTAARAAWHPGPGVHSIWQTVNHLTFWKELIARRLGGAPLSGGRIDNSASFGAPGDPTEEKSWLAAAERLKAAHLSLREAVASREDADLDAPPRRISPNHPLPRL